MCQRGVWTEGKARHKRTTGFPGLAGYSPQRAHSQGGQHRGFQEGGCEGGLAKDLKDSPLIFGLLVYGNIVDPVPEKKINLRIIVSRILPVWQVRGKYFLGLSLKSPGSICRALKEQSLAKAFENLVD